MTLEELENQAMQLPPSERERLAARLLHSIEGEERNEVEQAWVEEAERRLDELLNGQVKGIPAAQVMEDIRREFGWQH